MSKKVPKGWNNFLVKDAFDIGRGRVISKDEIRDKPGEYPVYSSQSTNDGRMGSINTYDFNGEYVTWTTDGAYAGTVFYRKGKFNCTNVCGTIKDNNSYPVNMRFIAEYLSTVAKNHVSYVGNPKLMNGVFGEIEILSPPLPEQNKIASILTSVDEVIENTRKQIDKLQDLKKATMNELLTKGIGHAEFKDSELGRIPKSWDVVFISDLAFIDRESLSSSTFPDYQFFYIDITSVKTCFIDIPSTKIKYSDSPSRARRVVKKGDVLLSTVRPNLKAFAYVENDCLDWVCSTGFSVLSPKDGNDGRFIFYSILSEFVTKQIEALVVGSNYPAINSTDVKSLLVLRPSLSEQKKIASILNSIDICIKNNHQKLHKTEALKKSLMQDLLTGKVRVEVNLWHPTNSTK